jgi:hypothetical protein
MRITTHASEAQHWYDPKDGSPAYEVRGANGLMRPATLRDARKLGLVPSVTGIINCCAKPGLIRWCEQQVLLAAMTLPRSPDEPESDWMARVMRDSKEQAKKAAERGTAIHAAIQGFFEDYAPQPGHFDHCIGVRDILQTYFGRSGWVAEKAFAHPLGFGGKVDLHAMGNPEVVADFKTKEFGPDDDLKTWDEHAMQLAAYREGLGMPLARCAIVYVSVTVPGLARVLEISQAELANGWAMFQGLLQYWKAKNEYWPEKVKEPA